MNWTDAIELGASHSESIIICTWSDDKMRWPVGNLTQISQYPIIVLNAHTMQVLPSSISPSRNRDVNEKRSWICLYVLHSKSCLFWARLRIAKSEAVEAPFSYLSPLNVLNRLGVLAPWFQPRSSHHQHGQGEHRLAVKPRTTLGRLVVVGQPTSSMVLFGPQKITCIIVMRGSKAGPIYQAHATRRSLVFWGNILRTGRRGAALEATRH